MKNTLSKSHILETINGCNDMINYLLSTDTVTFKTDTGINRSKDKKLIEYLLKYFKDIRNKYESKL